MFFDDRNILNLNLSGLATLPSCLPQPTKSATTRQRATSGSNSSAAKALLPTSRGGWQWSSDDVSFTDYTFTRVAGTTQQYTFEPSGGSITLLDGFVNALPNRTFTMRTGGSNPKDFVWNNTQQKAIDTSGTGLFWRRNPSHGPQAFPIGVPGESARILTDDASCSC